MSFLKLIYRSQTTPLKRLSSVQLKRRPYLLVPAQHFNSLGKSSVDQPQTVCDVEAEPLDRYCAGGYHPTHLGDVLNDQYKVLHKLGWGDFSTVWAARDVRTNTNVAVKVSTASKDPHNSKQFHALDVFGQSQSNHPGTQFVSTMQDYFRIEGPNGSHECIVQDLLGPSVHDILVQRFNGHRLPVPLVRRIARQVLLGLSSLQGVDTAHGDLNLRNLVFTMPFLMYSSEKNLRTHLGEPVTGLVQRVDQKPLDANTPRYLVRPTTFPTSHLNSLDTVKIIDFSQAFCAYEYEENRNAPLAGRAPEVLFGDQVNWTIDMWRMGCLLSEMIVGRNSFDNLPDDNPATVAAKFLQYSGDALPERWEHQWYYLNGGQQVEVPDGSFQEWFEEQCLAEGNREDLNKSDIGRVGEIITNMLWLDPRYRINPEDVLQDSWFFES